MPLRKKTLIVRVLLALLIVGGVTFMINYWFFMRFVRVPSGSMANTIIPGDHLAIHKRVGQIERGQIVMFHYAERSEYRLGRVVGLPGEMILVRGDIVYINERPLAEQRVKAEDSDAENPLKEISTEGNGPYRVFYTKYPKDQEFRASGDFGTNDPFKIPPDTFFLMGDNRDNSEDSRYIGPVPRETIWGWPSVIFYSEEMTPDGSIRWERIFKKLR